MDGLNHSVIVGKCPSCLIHEEKVARLEDELVEAREERDVAQETVVALSSVAQERDEAKAANVAKDAALRRVTQLIDYREHAFGQPEVEDGVYLKSLHDTLPQSHAALKDTGEGVVKRVFGEVDPAVATEPAVRGVLKETDKRIKEEVAAADRDAGEGWLPPEKTGTSPRG